MNPFVLLGAGSSKEAGIPTAVEMTRAMMDSFDQARNIDTLRVLRFVVGGLKMKQGIQNKDVFQEINIEELFASVEMLEKRHELEVAPFVAQWHSSVSEVERFRVHRGHLSRFEGSIRSIGRTIEKSLKNWAVIQKKSGSFGGANVSVDLSNPARAVRDSLQYIFDMVTRPPTGALFAQASQDMIESLSKMVWLDDAERVNYLVPLVEQAQDSVLSIATLNYDNTIELAGEAAEVPVSTGIEEWSQTGQFEKPKSGNDLLKLHGSIDWELDENRRGDIYGELRDRHGNLLNRLPHDVITQRPKDKVGEGRHTPSLIFGAGNKLTARGPYLELLRTFRQRLEEHNELLVIGYSFSDEHVNEVIYGWLNRDQERRITVVEKPGAVLGDNYFTKYFSNMLGERCTFVPEGAGVGIRSYFEVGVQKSGDV